MPRDERPGVNFKREMRTSLGIERPDARAEKYAELFGRPELTQLQREELIGNLSGLSVTNPLAARITRDLLVGHLSENASEMELKERRPFLEALQKVAGAKSVAGRRGFPVVRLASKISGTLTEGEKLVLAVSVANETGALGKPVLGTKAIIGLGVPPAALNYLTHNEASSRLAINHLAEIFETPDHPHATIVPNALRLLARETGRADAPERKPEEPLYALRTLFGGTGAYRDRAAAVAVLREIAAATPQQLAATNWNQRLLDKVKALE
ncbi:MAG: hypothetical protein WC607_02680 [Candidatus Micrarchaeia archaeon]